MALGSSDGRRTLFGLLGAPPVQVTYNVSTRTIGSVEGRTLPTDAVSVSDTLALNIPTHVEIDGVLLYPSRYEFFNDTDVLYHSRIPPFEAVVVNHSGDPLYERVRVVQARITPESLLQTDVVRSRVPTQNAVMGESASACARRLEQDGLIDYSTPATQTWQWCHLVAFSLLTTQRAQRRENILLGTATVNGQMANIEMALKWYVRSFGNPVSLEVTATYVADTPLGLRLRYAMLDRRTRLPHTEYFNLFAASRAAFVEAEHLAERMVSTMQPYGSRYQATAE